VSVLAGILHLDGAPAAIDDVAWAGRQGAAGWDDTGAYVEGSLGFRWQLRWTTPEAVGGQLPVVSSDNRFVLSYSGRIDNRAELIARYSAPAAATDGGLLAMALARDGVGGLRHCVGDFVLAAWDRVDRRLWLSRDAIGHRPLFYVRDRRRLLWSTDFQALRDGLPGPARPNAGFLAEYMSGTVASLDETVIGQIRRVPPAHAMSLRPGDPDFTDIEYWTPPLALPPRRSDADLIEEFQERFATAVGACLRARAGVAAELSGGLDSSAIVALTTALSGVAPATFSMVFPGAPFAPGGDRLDESEFIDAMVSAAGATSARFDPRTTTRCDALRILTVHGDLPDWPNADLMRWPMACAAASAGHRVLLTGVGGDQCLTGSIARLPSLLGAGHFFEAVRFLRDAVGRDRLEPLWLPMLRRLAAAAAPPLFKRAFRGIRPARPWPLWLRGPFVAEVNLAARLRALSSRVPDGIDAVLRDSLMQLAGAEGPLTRESLFRSADDAGLEARHPFFDRRLVEFMLTLPDDLRFRDGQTRYILRQAMRRRLPETIAARRDKGDGTILITHALRSVLAGMPLSSLRVADLGWVDGDRVRAACAELSMTGTRECVPRPADFSMWTVIAVEAWLRTL